MEPQELMASNTRRGIVPIVISSVLVAALAAGGGVYAYQKSQNNKAQSDLQTQIDTLNSRLAAQSVTPAATISSTATPVAAVTPVAQSTATPATGAVVANTYVNTKYNFQVPLGGEWQGYKVMQQSSTSADTIAYQTFYFNLPTTDPNFVATDYQPEGYASPFAVTLYKLADWDKVQKAGGPIPTYITKNSTYVAAYYMWQSAPEDLSKTLSASDIKAAATSFMFTK